MSYPRTNHSLNKPQCSTVVIHKKKFNLNYFYFVCWLLYMICLMGFNLRWGCPSTILNEHTFWLLNECHVFHAYTHMYTPPDIHTHILIHRHTYIYIPHIIISFPTSSCYSSYPCLWLNLPYLLFQRGWTTFLTAAVDERVSYMAPVVFSALNLSHVIYWLNAVKIIMVEIYY